MQYFEPPPLFDQVIWEQINRFVSLAYIAHNTKYIGGAEAALVHVYAVGRVRHHAANLVAYASRRSYQFVDHSMGICQV